MERFQRTKYLHQIAAVRRELSGWISTYRTICLPENELRFTPRQREVADRRQYWLEDVVVKLEELEDDLDNEEDA